MPLTKKLDNRGNIRIGDGNGNGNGTEEQDMEFISKNGNWQSRELI